MGMNARQRVTCVCFCVAVVLSQAAFAIRGAPKDVPPVTYEGVEYRAPQNPSRLGYVEAWDTASGRKLWETRVYRVLINPLLEEDVQWVFIKGLQIRDGKLLVTNEAGRSFTLDARTGRVLGRPAAWLAWVIGATVLAVAAAYAIARRRTRRKGAQGDGASGGDSP